MIIHKECSWDSITDAKNAGEALCKNVVEVLTDSTSWNNVKRRKEDELSQRQDEFHAKCNLYYLSEEDPAVKEEWRLLNNSIYDRIAALNDAQSQARAEKVRIKAPKKFYS